MCCFDCVDATGAFQWVAFDKNENISPIKEAFLGDNNNRKLDNEMDAVPFDHQPCNAHVSSEGVQHPP